MQEQDAKRPGRGRSTSGTSLQRERRRIGQVLPADPSLPQGPTRERVSPPPHTAIMDTPTSCPLGTNHIQTLVGGGNIPGGQQARGGHGQRRSSGHQVPHQGNPTIL